MAVPPHLMSQPDGYQAYLMRLWQTGSDGNWRALLQSVHTGEKLHFANLESLYAYLQAQTTEDDDNPGDNAGNVIP